MATSARSRDRDARAAVAEVPLWYHTVEVAPGVATPGWFDLRPIVDVMPWPDVRGKRCLDVGTYDGFLAFELERRGAAEVVATDISSHEEWDWPPVLRARGPEALAELAGPDKSEGFRVAGELLGSSVERLELSVYELSPDAVGEFDIVVCGSLMLHLRDPMRAMAAIRSVCRDRFLSAEEIDLRLTVLHPRRPLLRLDGLSNYCQWYVPNRAGHVQMLRAAGFSVERSSGSYAIPFGAAHPEGNGSAKARAVGLSRRLLAGRDGVPHHAALVRV